METLLRGSEDAVDDFASRTRELEDEFDRRRVEVSAEDASLPAPQASPPEDASPPSSADDREGNE
ncbi:hypothetical protein Sme01_64330 [Sphaerisporangium melleum]|uniref:Uncharacterized protein n=2 Tax=Sphaerisporangium melleum TaxID=321316 RepID=A0A917VP86_9ACTN|nr:hypothetical protein GCM10007964_53880 [Sphaerisporangium melleum]GII73957.1 hypothetical protein Sme01_64330 [Sphaerisporangium melleum]